MEYSSSGRPVGGDSGGDRVTDRPIGPNRSTVSMRPLRRRACSTTAVVPVGELPSSPRALSGMRRAQLTGLYLRLLETALDSARNGGPASRGFRRADRLVSQVRLRLGLVG